MSERIYIDNYTFLNRLPRFLWLATQAVLFRPFRSTIFNRWRIFLLRLFGAKIGKGCKVGATARIWAPWNLTMGNYVCLADGVDCYSADRITLGDYSAVSQRAYLCAASHDISTLSRPLTSAPITISKHAWVCAEAYIGAGVSVGEGAVVAARSVVVRPVDPWIVVAGNPARKVKDRVVSDTKKEP